MRDLTWKIVPFGVVVVTAGYLAAALVKAALYTWWPDLTGVIPLYGIAIGAALVLVGLTWSELPGLMTTAIGAGIAASFGLLLLALYGSHPEVLLFGWTMIPAVSAVAVQVFGQLHNDPSLSDRSFKAYVFCLVAFAIFAGGTALIAIGRSGLQNLLPTGWVNWIAVALGLFFLVVGIAFAIIAGRTRPRT